jgi:hypothetical protein
MFNYRQKIQIYGLIILMIITYIAPPAYQIAWGLGALLVASLLVVGKHISKLSFKLLDFMFLKESDFIYEPDYKNWKTRVATD